MKTIALALVVSAFALGSMASSAGAQSKDICEKQAVSKTGKVLTGAAKDASVNKCMRDACTGAAIDKNGKKLTGAAKNSFMKKCQAG